MTASGGYLPLYEDGHDIDLLLKVCEMYYQQRLTQQEIANVLGVSRVSVSRLLSSARDRGIVQVSIIDPRLGLAELSGRLEELYGLQKAVVVAGSHEDDVVKQRVGRVGAQLLESYVRDGDTVGIGRGTTVYQTVNQLPGRVAIPSSHVVPLVGSAGLFDSYFQVNEMARHAAEILGARCAYLNAPFSVSSLQIKEALLQDELVAECVNHWGSLDVVVIGIGATGLSDNPAYSARVKAVEIREGRKAAADICGRLIDNEGEPMEGEHDLLIAATLENLHNARLTIGVAGGKTKPAAIRAALRGKHINVLVTDDTCARMFCSVV